MKEIYVILGNRQLNNRLEDGTGDEGYVELVVDNRTLNNTYKGFLEDCCETLTQSGVGSEQRPTYLAVREAAFDQDPNVVHSVHVYDRSSNQGQTFSLEQKVASTAGDFLYTSQQEVGGQVTGIQTLEMYILSDGIGGRE